MSQTTDNKNRNTLNKGCCATCVQSLVWHEVWGGRLIYHGLDLTTVVGFRIKWSEGRSDRFVCTTHRMAPIGPRNLGDCHSCGYRKAIALHTHGPKKELMPLCESCLSCAFTNEFQDTLWEEDN